MNINIKFLELEKIIKSLIVLLVVFTFTACTKNEVTYLELSINSNKELNQDKSKVSSPLMLVFYELESAEKFSKLTYWDLLKKSGDKLNTDLISQSKHVIIPKQEHVYKIKLDDKAKFLGVIAKFSDISKPTWRYVINLEQGSTNDVELEVKDYKITGPNNGE